MDSYVDLFQKHGGSMITLAKGNRSKQVTNACKTNRGSSPTRAPSHSLFASPCCFQLCWALIVCNKRVCLSPTAPTRARVVFVRRFYLGSIGGPAAILAKNCIKKVPPACAARARARKRRCDAWGERQERGASSFVRRAHRPLIPRTNIKQVEVLEYPELGMEAIWKIEARPRPRQTGTPAHVPWGRTGQYSRVIGREKSRGVGGAVRTRSWLLPARVSGQTPSGPPLPCGDLPAGVVRPASGSGMACVRRQEWPRGRESTVG